MHSNSMTITLARIANHIRQRYGGEIGKDDLILVLSEYGVNQEAIKYLNRMVYWGFLCYDHTANLYRMTDAGKQMVTISITVPLLNSNEIRRDLVGRYAGYAGVIEVGEVEL